jgi:hypothetical protein
MLQEPLGGQWGEISVMMIHRQTYGSPATPLPSEAAE